MIRYTTLGAALTALALLGGCDKSPTEAQNEARDAQRRADEEAADARRKAEQEAQKAQSKANEEARKADEALVKARNDFRAQAQKDLNDLSAEIDDLKAKAAKTTGKAKADIDVAVQRLDDQRNALRREVDALDRASASDFESAKQHFSAGLASLRKGLSDSWKVLNDGKI